MTIRILITGSRTWPAPWVIHSTLADTWHDIVQDCGPHAPWVLVHGACGRGADAMAALYARRNHIPQDPHPAQWSAHGKKAGPLRNQHMADLGADLCVAFLHNNSSGTLHMVRCARRAGIPTQVVHWPPVTAEDDPPRLW